MKPFTFIKLQEEIGSSSWFGFSMIIDESYGLSRNKLVEILIANNIECRPIVSGNIIKNEMIDYFDYSIFGNLDVADTIHNQGLFIGNHHIDIKDGLKNLVETLQDCLK